MIDEEQLTFEDGILLCKHIYQCAIHKTLHGVMEEWEIFQRSHDMLTQLQFQRADEFISNLEFSQNLDKKRLDELLFKFNIDNIYATI